MFFLLSLTYCFTLFSQKKWTLKECIQYAIEHNISVKQSQLSLASNKTNIKNAKGNFLPSVNGNFSNSINFSSSINSISNTTKIYSGNTGINANINVFNGFKNLNYLKKAELNGKTSELELEKVKNDVTLNVINAYLNILFAKENLTVAKTQAEISHTQIKQVKAQFDEGAVPKTNLLNIQATAANDLQNVVIRKNALQLALLQLKQLLQITDENFDITAINSNLIDKPILYKNATIVYEKAIKNQPNILKGEYNIKKANVDINIAKAGYLPNVSAGANVGSRYEFNLDSSNNPRLSKQLEDNFGYGGSVTVSIPIFNGFKNDAGVERAKIDKDIIETNLAQEKLRLKQTIDKAYLDAMAAKKTYESANISLNAQKEAFRVSKISYELGNSTLFDFDQIRNRLVNAESSLIRAKYDYIFKTKVLQFYYGDNITE